MAAELDAKLEAVQAAIDSLIDEGIQSYTIALPDGGTQTVTRLDLERLRAWRDNLKREISTRDSGRGGFVNYARRGNL